MSRLILKYFDIFKAAAKLWGVANSLGSVRLEWPCMATIILCFSAKGATLWATGRAAGAEGGALLGQGRGGGGGEDLGAQGLRDLEAAVDLLVREARVERVVVAVDLEA